MKKRFGWIDVLLVVFSLIALILIFVFGSFTILEDKKLSVILNIIILILLYIFFALIVLRGIRKKDGRNAK